MSTYRVTVTRTTEFQAELDADTAQLAAEMARLEANSCGEVVGESVDVEELVESVGVRVWCLSSERSR